MSGHIDNSYFRELAEKDPCTVCRRSMCTYDQVDKGYTLDVWHQAVRILPERAEIICNISCRVACTV